MIEQKQKQAKSKNLHYFAGILCIVILACLTIYLLQSYGWMVSSRSANQQRTISIESASEKKWAAHLELPGVPKLHRVSQDLYRGGQPTAEGMRHLEKLGIKTVINLRIFDSDREKIAGTKLSYERIKMTTWHPENEDVIRFLRIVTDPNRTPIFVHCQRGADRTGTLCAIYRIAVQGWSKNEAIEEMTKGSFGFNPLWMNLPHFIRKLDVDEIKRSAGLNK